MKLVEAGREVEKMKSNFLTIFGVDIEAFDNIHDKLADAAFQAIISTKFGGNPPNERGGGGCRLVGQAVYLG